MTTSEIVATAHQSEQLRSMGDRKCWMSCASCFVTRRHDSLFLFFHPNQGTQSVADLRAGQFVVADISPEALFEPRAGRIKVISLILCRL